MHILVGPGMYNCNEVSSSYTSGFLLMFYSALPRTIKNVTFSKIFTLFEATVGKNIIATVVSGPHF